MNASITLYVKRTSMNVVTQPPGEGHRGCGTEGRGREGGCSGVRCFLREERGGVGRQEGGSDPVMIP